MAENLTAHASTTIDAPRDAVWRALVTPEIVERYMFGAQIESDWKVGGAITWKGEFKGKPYEDRGVIRKFEPLEALDYTHFSPLSGKPDRPENHHLVRIRLSGAGDSTQVSLSQDNNADERSRDESQRNWEHMLRGLKEEVEVRA
jgi:uncharacterized protein YndB with AHSA1/START domain